MAEPRRLIFLLIREGKENPQRKTFIYVNNRLEGNALPNITAMLQM